VLKKALQLEIIMLGAFALKQKDLQCTFHWLPVPGPALSNYFIRGNGSFSDSVIVLSSSSRYSIIERGIRKLVAHCRGAALGGGLVLLNLSVLHRSSWAGYTEAVDFKLGITVQRSMSTLEILLFHVLNGTFDGLAAFFFGGFFLGPTSGLGETVEIFQPLSLFSEAFIALAQGKILN
jgi:hypothetical protein